MEYLDVADRIWPLLRRAAGLHTLAYRATGGRIGQSIPGVPGKMCLLDHVGAKSGTRRTTPLLYIRDGENLVLVASKGGYPRHPAWFHNLKANPETTVQVGGDRIPVSARVASEEERERLWPELYKAWPDFRTYRARSHGREIPLLILEPRR
jgi:F420H(2)-dependent quinone reductase